MSLALSASDVFAAPAPLRAPRPMHIMREVSLDVSEAWRARSGDDLAGETIRLRLVGNPDGPAVLVLGGISAGRQVAAEDDGWWRVLAGPGRVLDTDRYLIIGADYPPLAATRPVDLCPEDVAQLLKLGLERAGVQRLAAFVGSSFGGMVGLAFARLYPETTERLAVLCAGHRPSPMAAAVRHVQRQIVELTSGTNREADGVALARQLAMTTYRTQEEFDARFAKRRGECLVSYLTARGRAYAEDVSAARFQTLSAAIDAHEEDPAAIAVPTLVIAADSDRLVPTSITGELAALLPKCLGYEVIPSLYGHDAFLKETATIGRHLRRVLP